MVDHMLETFIEKEKNSDWKITIHTVVKFKHPGDKL